MENEDIEYEVENQGEQQNIVIENEIGSPPPLVVVVQGGKGVFFLNFSPENQL